MRSIGSKHDDQWLDQLPATRSLLPQLIHVFHHCGDRGVVLQPFGISGHFANRAVQLLFGRRRPAVLSRRDLCLMGQCPYLLQKSPNPDDAFVAEVAALLKRPQEHEVHAERVGAPLLDVGIGYHDVAARLRHLGAVLHDQTVRAKFRIRRIEVQQPEIGQDHADKTGIEQMEHGVLVPPDVARHGKPFLRPCLIERPVVELCRRIAQVVPG